MEICYEATNTNPNSIYISIKICLEGYTPYDLTAYIDSGCSVYFEKRALFPEFMWKKAKNILQVRIADNSIMSHNEAIEGLNMEIGGVQCIIPVLWATNQPSHDMIIGNNFQRLYSPCIQTKTQIIFTIKDHSIPIEKLNKAYTHQTIAFTQSQRGEKVISAQREIALNISLLELSIKEQLAEQQEKLCKELYSDNPLKYWDKDKIFAKITLLNPNTVILVKQMVYTHQDIQEFDKQIKELLDKGLIRNSKSPLTSPAFMVRNHAEEKRGKARMVINYKKT